MSDRGNYASKLLTSIDEVVCRVGDVHGLTLQVLKAPHFGYHSTVLFLEAKSARYVLKVLDSAEFGVRKVRSSLDTQQALARRGIPVASPQKGEDGQLFSTVGENICILYPKAPGTGFDLGRPQQLVAAGTTLATIHSADYDGLALCNTSLSEVAESCVVRAARLSWPVDLKIDRLRDLHFGDHGDSLLHGDFRAQNVLFRDDSVSCVLDWDDAVIGPRLLDLCYSLIFFQAVIQHAAPSVDAMRRFLRGYEGEYPITPDEWDRMSVCLSVALFKGLTLWTTIWNETRDPGVKVRIRSWIEEYAPLGDIMPSVATRLRI